MKKFILLPLCALALALGACGQQDAACGEMTYSFTEPIFPTSGTMTKAQLLAAETHTKVEETTSSGSTLVMYEWGEAGVEGVAYVFDSSNNLTNVMVSFFESVTTDQLVAFYCNNGYSVKGNVTSYLGMYLAKKSPVVVLIQEKDGKRIVMYMSESFLQQ